MVRPLTQYGLQLQLQRMGLYVKAHGIWALLIGINRTSCWVKYFSCHPPQESLNLKGYFRTHII